MTLAEIKKVHEKNRRGERCPVVVRRVIDSLLKLLGEGGGTDFKKRVVKLKAISLKSYVSAENYEYVTKTIKHFEDLVRH